MPIYLQQAPDPNPDTVLPYAGPSPLGLSEGSHLGYAGQYFMFAIAFAVGYPMFVRHQLREAANRQAEPDLNGQRKEKLQGAVASNDKTASLTRY